MNKIKHPSLVSAAGRLGVPPKTFRRISDIKITGDERILIENHGTVSEYTESRIILIASGKIITVAGEKMTLETLGAGGLEVTGRIFSVSIERV